MSLSDVSCKFTEETLDAIVQKCGGVRHTAWRFGTGFKKGDSYLSDSFRMIVDGVDEKGEPVEVKLIVKAMPKNVGRCKTFRIAEFFRNECMFYEHVLTAMRDFQERRGILDSAAAFTEVPQYLFGYNDGVNDFVALEDLCPGGYASAPRQDGLDYAHCRLVLQTLGKFHAVSLAIGDQEPELLAKMIAALKEVYYAEENRAWYAPFLKDQIVVTTDAVTKEYPGTKYERSMRELTDDGFYSRMVEMTHRRTPFSVIGHGDCWLPNFLMRYSDGKPVHAKMIDFQLGRFGSPALDISFFIYSCTLQAMREQHYEQLLRDYHDSVTELLTALGSDAEKVFPWSGLQQEMRQSARFGVGMGMESLPLSMQDESELSDLDVLESEEAVPLTVIWKIKPIESKEKRLRLADIFKHGVDMGYLD